MPNTSCATLKVSQNICCSNAQSVRRHVIRMSLFLLSFVKGSQPTENKKQTKFIVTNHSHIYGMDSLKIEFKSN